MRLRLQRTSALEIIQVRLFIELVSKILESLLASRPGFELIRADVYRVLVGYCLAFSSLPWVHCIRWDRISILGAQIVWVIAAYSCLPSSPVGRIPPI